jgi:hypothetical protein
LPGGADHSCIRVCTSFEPQGLLNQVGRLNLPRPVAHLQTSEQQVGTAHLQVQSRAIVLRPYHVLSTQLTRGRQFLQLSQRHRPGLLAVAGVVPLLHRRGHRRVRLPLTKVIRFRVPEVARQP